MNTLALQIIYDNIIRCWVYAAHSNHIFHNEFLSWYFLPDASPVGYLPHLIREKHFVWFFFFSTSFEMMIYLMLEKAHTVRQCTNIFRIFSESRWVHTNTVIITIIIITTSFHALRSNHILVHLEQKGWIFLLFIYCLQARPLSLALWMDVCAKVRVFRCLYIPLALVTGRNLMC